MMIKLRRNADRGHTRLSWLDSRHTFSFDNYHDPKQTGFRTLRVINEDHVSGGHGFDLHPHRDMEILSFVYAGALEHEDNLGHRGRIETGELQCISAGTGVRHSERNPDKTEVHFLQVWILPDQKGLVPGYQKGRFLHKERLNSPQLIAAQDGRQGVIAIHQDVDIYAGMLEKGRSLLWDPTPKGHLWLQLVAGGLKLKGHRLEAGDGAAVSGEGPLQMEAAEEAEFLLFQLG